MGRPRATINPKQGIRLKYVLDECQLSQNDLAEKIHVGQQAVSKYVTCKTQLPQDTAEAIASVCNVRASWLLGLDDWKTDNEIVGYFIGKEWDREDAIEKLLDTLGYNFIATGKGRSTIHCEIDGEMKDVCKVVKDEPSAYNIFYDKKIIAQCSFADISALSDEIADFAEFKAKKLCEKRGVYDG